MVGTNNSGSYRKVHGTYTSAAGDQSGTLSATTHGLNYIINNKITPSAVNATEPKVAISSGTLTITSDGTLAASGRWMVKGEDKC